MRSLVVPLANLTTPRTITIDSRFTLRQVTQAELDSWRKDEYVKAILRTWVLSDICGVVEGHAETTDDSEVIGDQSFNEDFYALVALLQLRANRIIRCPFGEVGFHSNIGVQRRIVELSFARPIFSAQLDSITLRNAEDADIEEYWKKITAPETNSRKLRFALGRWSLAKGRMWFEDALVDAWIGLEALFTDHAPEITKQASSRIAQFLADGFDKKTTFNQVADAYNKRSRIVHGDLVAAEDIRSATDFSMHVLWICLNKLLTLDLSSFDARSLQEQYFAS